MSTTLRTLAAVAAATMLALAFARADEPAATGAIVGAVRCKRKVDDPGRIFVTKDRHACGDEIASDRLVLGSNGELANVVVTLAKKDTPAAPYRDFPPKAPVIVDQKSCRYVPRVAVAAVGQPVHFTNSDPVTHSLQAKSVIALDTWDPTIEANGKVERTFDRADRWTLGCAIHPFMRKGGVLVVTAHPWTTLTGKQGTFRLDRLPPGRYHVVLWHEALEDARLEKEGVEAVVEAGKTTELEVAFE